MHPGAHCPFAVCIFFVVLARSVLGKFVRSAPPPTLWLLGVAGVCWACWLAGLLWLVGLGGGRGGRVGAVGRLLVLVLACGLFGTPLALSGGQGALLLLSARAAAEHQIFSRLCLCYWQP